MADARTGSPSQGATQAVDDDLDLAEEIEDEVVFLDLLEPQLRWQPAGKDIKMYSELWENGEMQVPYSSLNDWHKTACVGQSLFIFGGRSVKRFGNRVGVLTTNRK